MCVFFVDNKQKLICGNFDKCLYYLKISSMIDGNNNRVLCSVVFALKSAAMAAYVIRFEWNKPATKREI